jgi:hypothetical protein
MRKDLEVGGSEINEVISRNISGKTERDSEKS